MTHSAPPPTHKHKFTHLYDHLDHAFEEGENSEENIRDNAGNHSAQLPSRLTRPPAQATRAFKVRNPSE